MTFNQLSKIIKQNHIPKNVHLLSDSGWECCETEMDGVYYNKNENVIVFTQSCSEYEKYDPNFDRKYSKIDGYIPLTKEEDL